ncbi:putative O-glycosylation ligase, exosortase A system-associated [Ectothiorhodospira marina]|uniref:Probable O-glycosylation ligase, exosortase A-associated n=1 Tax=Ectothiorhodospira marina TaxID=1396821 RepID=A0A1H7IBZ7_9GAMM|nr:putative O-glycosylation ligase, exosortase A system-associated [Ectothiorhodospira marina]SEK59050.1 probable O-glycosylation ligase, exosortase A-associated [Ectothiorhodospira marina]
MRDIIFSGIWMGLVAAALFRPWIGIVGWYWIGIMNPHQLTWGFARELPVAMGIAGATLVGLLLTKDRRALPFTPEIVILVLMVIHFTITTYLAWSPGPAWAQWDKVMKIFLITLITPMLIFGKQRIMMLFAILTLSIGYYGLKGGIHSLTTGFGGMVLGPQRSFIGGNTDIGMALIMILPMTLVLARLLRNNEFELPFQNALFDRWRSQIGLGMYAVFWLTAAAIIGTHSRGAMLTLIIISPFIFKALRHKTLIVSAALIAVFGLGLAVPDQIVERMQTLQEYEEDSSSMGRIAAWSVSWNIAMETPLTGSGFQTFHLPRDVWNSYVTWTDPLSRTLVEHSIYFQMLGQHGFPGLALFLLLLTVTLFTLNRIRRSAARYEDTRWMSGIAWAMMIGIFGYMICGAFLSLAYFDLFYAMVALTIVLRRELHECETARMAQRQHAFSTHGLEESRQPAPGTSPATQVGADFVRSKPNGPNHPIQERRP